MTIALYSRDTIYAICSNVDVDVIDPKSNGKLGPSDALRSRTFSGQRKRSMMCISMCKHSRAALNEKSRLLMTSCPRRCLFQALWKYFRQSSASGIWMPDSTFASFSLDRRPFVFAFSLVAFSDYHIVSSRCFLSSNFFGLAVIRFREFDCQSGDRAR